MKNISLIINFFALIKKLVIFPIFIILLCARLEASDSLHYRPLTIALTNNATALPGSGKLVIFNLPVHPGLTIGTYFNFRKRPKHNLSESIKLGYFYHRFAQHAIQVYAETGYEYYVLKMLSVNIKYGLGYLHSITDREIFILNEQGEYEQKKDYGRPQFMTGLNLGCNFSVNKPANPPLKFFINYQFWFQLPFVKEYVPLLPNTTLHLGMEIPLKLR